ncbi:hypothetical protein [Saccharopolyspora mangrovi]|uniref:hypothetical protein n=1 Tax=Saccharopolyspora mangrovi TaxID=3082379 RepID=UPI002B4BDE81|nr:hypothetical protein [Saccharopolyspora sp. S2-29]
MHNNTYDALFFGYTLRDTLTCVYTYTDPDVQPATTGVEVAERAFELFTVGRYPAHASPDPRAVAYRELGHRSLSVGDVVCVDGHFFACEPFGWNEIDPPSETSLEHPDTTRAP